MAASETAGPHARLTWQAPRYVSRAGAGVDLQLVRYAARHWSVGHGAEFGGTVDPVAPQRHQQTGRLASGICLRRARDVPAVEGAFAVVRRTLRTARARTTPPQHTLIRALPPEMTPASLHDWLASAARASSWQPMERMGRAVARLFCAGTGAGTSAGTSARAGHTPLACARPRGPRVDTCGTHVVL